MKLLSVPAACLLILSAVASSQKVPVSAPSPPPPAGDSSGVQVTVVGSPGPLSSQGLAVPTARWGGTSLIVRAFIPATSSVELFTLHVPPSAPGDERPLLVAFHSLGTSHLDIAGRTDFLEQAIEREWFLIAPLFGGPHGDPQKSYGNVESQANVEAILAMVLGSFDVDRDRIYGVGFSMGGGAALSYAARHRDRARGAFAAVVNHTGTVSLENTWFNWQASGRQVMEVALGGDPASVPFAYQRSSTIELDNAGLLIQSGRHMARNLELVPVQTSYAIADPLAFIINQSMEFDAYMSSLPGATHEIIALPPPATGCPSGHCWASLDQIAACDWLEQFTLHPDPLSGFVLADRSAKWGIYELEQTTTGGFSSFEFTCDPSQNYAEFRALENVASLAFDLDEAGLDGSINLEIHVTGNVAGGRAIVLRGYPDRPQSVMRNGMPAVEVTTGSPSFAAWQYDAATDELMVWSPAGSALEDWFVSP